MTKRTTRDTAICSAFCTYYKPGKNEELACQGVIAARQLGVSVPKPHPPQVLSAEGGKRALLLERVCGCCSFREKDCDHAESRGTLPACGGFRLLSHLLAAGAIADEEIAGMQRPARRKRRSRG